MAYTTINKHTDHFNTVLYTGNGSTNAITGVGFQPDFVWCKDRDAGNNHIFHDAVRGVNYQIYSDIHNAQTNASGFLTAFGTDGFTLGSDGAINQNSSNYASWNWKGAGSTASNSNGSITSTVSANTTAGFSIVKYTGTGSNATVGHGLSAAPRMILFKNLSSARNWIVYHKGRGATKNLYLDMNNSVNTASDTFNNTAPTSTVFSIGSSVGTNESGDDIIAYCFTDIRGYLKTGVYYGNTVAGDPYVHLGFKPTLLLIKNSDATQNWRIIDNKRLGYNSKNNPLFPSVSNSEGTSETTVDLLSTGFRVMGTGEAVNGNGHRHIYLAIGQTLVGSNNVCATAR